MTALPALTGALNRVDHEHALTGSQHLRKSPDCNWLWSVPFYRDEMMVLRRLDKQKTRRAWELLAVILICTSLMILGINLYVAHGTKARIFDQISEVPQRDFGLVMGTDSLRFDGSTNLHFLNRTDGAASAYLSGKVSHLLISGNKNNNGFNEVAGMEDALLKKGVPKNALILDFEGNSTWESVRRTKEVYHLQKITIITDAFHAPRSIFLCRHFGVDAVAFCYGKESFGFWSIRYHAREWLACVKAFFKESIDK